MQHTSNSPKSLPKAPVVGPQDLCIVQVFGEACYPMKDLAMTSKLEGQVKPFYPLVPTWSWASPATSRRSW